MQNKYFKWLIFSVSALIILIAVFSLGVKVGFHQGRFTENWEREYPANFGTFIGSPIKPGINDPHLNPHGVFGNIISKEGLTLIIEGMDDNEKSVVISTSTSIRQNFNNLTPADLKINDPIIVIGEPDNLGQINAKFIRVLNEH